MPQTRQASLYEVQGKTRDDGRFYKSPLCPNDGSPVMPYIGDMGPHDEGHCFKCNQAVKFVSVDEREVDEWKKQFDQPVRHCLTYVGRFAPGKFCPKCGKQLTVNEKAYNTIDPERPHYERRLTCPGFFTTGCRHREAFTIEVQNLIDAEAAARENAPAEF